MYDYSERRTPYLVNDIYEVGPNDPDSDDVPVAGGETYAKGPKMAHAISI